MQRITSHACGAGGGI